MRVAVVSNVKIVLELGVNDLSSVLQAQMPGLVPEASLGVQFVSI